ncbi:MAG: DNA polymerase III delta prime subunit [Cryomorphaceae bacterium]|jgi:DNA polymerase III delta prime subunit
MDNPEPTKLLELVNYGINQGGFESDDVLVSLLPLMEQVLKSHEANLVAPLNGCDALHVNHSKLWYPEVDAIYPILNKSKITALSDADKGLVMEVIDRADQTVDLDHSSEKSTNLRVWGRPEIPTYPVYVIGYETWEQRVGHHDALTDVFSLGMVLASIATGLNFYQVDQLEQFVEQRDTLHQHYERIHPVILTTIVRMTELQRDKRVQDLRSVISVLRNYREQNFNEEIDFSQQEGFINSNDGGKRRMINSHLRDRLFDMSKRNKLIHFRSTMQTVNLTVSSVPLMLDYKNIRAESLFTWQPKLAEALANESSIPLDRYLRFEDAPYLPHSLDSLRRDASRDVKEYGFSQLRFVIAFFRWHNLKEDKSNRINSPLLLHPVELIKKKGVRDTWHLQPIGTQVDVNPALRYYLKQTYDLDLPEAIDLSETSVEDFYSLLKQQIQASEPAVELKLIDKPQIDLVKQRARKRLNTYMKRRKITGRSVKKYDDIDYSYNTKSLKPLGLQLFLNKVKPSELPLQYILSEKPTLRTPGIAAEATEIEAKKDAYHLREGSEVNPYVWDFDLCSLTLANFSYKKMSLVRDYNTLLEKDRANPVFDEIFSLSPREDFKQQNELKLDDQFLIVPADPSQISTVAAARSGESLIIQGPPGTGKSQTITNLIADFVANGKRVLFVCEKRAALDVVYQRLTASKLEELTCIIHDSQADKKAFIHDLRKTYEEFLNHEHDVSKLERKIKTKLKNTNKELSALQRFGDAMTVNIHPDSDEPYRLRDLLGRMIKLKSIQPEIGELELEAYPEYSQWLDYGESVRNITAVLDELGKGDIFANTPFSTLKRQVYQVDSPVLTLKTQVEELKRQLDGIQQQLATCSFDTKTCTLEELRHLSFVADSVRYLAKNNLLSLLDKQSAESKELKKFQRKFKTQSTKLANAQKLTIHWLSKLTPRDTDAALAIAPDMEKGITRFFSPSFWRLRKVIKASYKFQAHAVAPSWSQILTELQSEHKLSAKREECQEEAKDEFGADDMLAVIDNIEEFKARRSAVPVDDNDADSFYQCLIKNDEKSSETIAELANMHDELLRLDQLLEKFVRKSDTLEIPEVISLINALEEDLPILPELLSDLQELCQAEEALYTAFCDHPFNADQHEAACGMKSLAVAYREDRELSKFEGWMLRKHTDKAQKNYTDWLNTNGNRIVTKVGSYFKQLHAKASLPASQLEPAEKEFKKSFNAGRRELEHEFGKTMRYKSIRDLATGDSGQVVLALKPIWLMSPLSISDTMPLEDNQFDVVIFDEASQIKLEEAIPAVQRAKQVIVVGDEMQLPPTNFFDTASQDEDEFVSFEEEGETYEYDLSSDSFLTHASKTLPSKMLGWHYRSRYEALISFSNHTFYHGNLLTIPDRTFQQSELAELLVTGVNDFTPAASDVLDRSISYHFLDDGVYESRQNLAEANYIAYLVRELLNEDESEPEARKTIGIVAFSEAQQDKIETALSHLADDDKEFSRKLNLERDREDDGQHCGLFVKNLENVQGDERDIMLLSICYAPDSNGKMRMNFGPINRTGGEKRLNVIFSRAKHHMAIITSIKSKQITNDYNDGANCLKRFLQYAEAVSQGDTVLANHVLSQHSDSNNNEGDSSYTTALEKTLSAALTAKGYLLEHHVGESDFTCELAIRNPDDSLHKLAILTDSEAHYKIENSLERYILRAGILEAFGWQVIQVLAKDWYHDPDQVLLSIDRIMNGGAT